jgi:hypothetical protein
VVQVSGNTFATTVPNQLAFRVERIHSGFIPVPIAWWADALADRLAKRNIILEWTEMEGDTVALLTLPRFNERSIDNPQTGSNTPSQNSQVDKQYSTVEAVAVMQGSIEIAGRTINLPPQ